MSLPETFPIGKRHEPAPSASGVLAVIEDAATWVGPDGEALHAAAKTVEAMAEALDLLLHDRTPWSVTCAREALARYHGRTES